MRILIGRASRETVAAGGEEDSMPSRTRVKARQQVRFRKFTILRKIDWLVQDENTHIARVRNITCVVKVVFLYERSIFALYVFPVKEPAAILSNIPLPSSPMIFAAIFDEI